jgi:hypothetical protein
MLIAPREDIVNGEPLYQAILACGIKDGDIKNGSVVMARIHRCGGPKEVNGTRRLLSG